MASTFPYTISQSEYQRTEQVEEAVLVFTVKDLTGSPAGRAPDATMAPGVPRWMAAHPTKPNLRAVGFRSVPVENQPSTFNVIVRYRVPRAAESGIGAAPTINVSTTTISEEVVRDINGDLMQLKYVSRVAAGVGGSSVSVTTQTHRVQVQRPTFTVQFSRTEGSNAFATALEYSGTVNLRTWQGQPRASWLMNIASSDNGDGTHRFTYSAVYNPTTWQAEIRVAVNGRLPETATVGNGIEFRDVYDLADFGPLGLPRII